MTVENTTSRQVAQQMGTLYTYPFTFTVLLTDPTEDEALKAIKAKVKQADGSEIDLVYGSEGADGYTVTLNTNRNGGSVTVVDKRTASDYITIYREYEETQEADYQDFNAAPAETYEQCFDKLTMLCQQQQEKIDRCIKVDMTSDITPAVFVDQIVRIYDSIDNVDTVANNSADVSTVADNITDVNTCADSISNINATGSNINNVNICAQNINDINTCADDIAAIKDAPAQAQSAANSAQSAASSETAAASSQQAAYLSQIAAADSERYAEIWAEGTDDEVQSIGGTHSSKVWSEISAGGGANVDLSNLTELGEKHFLNKTQLTNCILSAPNGVATFSGNAITVKQGLKVLIPNGRNADGTLNNIEYTTDERVYTEVTPRSENAVITLAIDNTGKTNAYINYFSQEENPNTPYTCWYKPSENNFYVSDSLSDFSLARIVPILFYKSSNLQITNVIPYNTVDLLKRSDKAEITGWGFPSGVYEDWTLLASGQKYTAPCDGKLVFSKYGTAVGQYIQFNASEQDLTSKNMILTGDEAVSNLSLLYCDMEMKKGQETKIYYDAAGDTMAFRFIYAEGVK